MEESSSELQQLLETGLAALGVPAVPVEPWVKLAELLARWGVRLNLTAHADARTISKRLLLEAAALERVLPAAESIVDLGSGAGIPGIPIALCRPRSQVWLVESRERRHHFQRAAIRALALDNVEALRGRAEQLEPRRSELVVSQAFARPEQAIAWMRPWVSPGGWIALATVPDFSGPSHMGPGFGVLREYAAPGGSQRAVWLARERSARP